MDRAVSPVVAIVVLIGVSIAGAAGVAALGSDVVDVEDRGASPTLTASADFDTQTVALAHHGGASLDLRNCSMTIHVAGDPLLEQPPVPYFAAAGFEGAPTGAFNSASDSVFEPGERARLSIAATNAPHFDPGDRVTVRIHRADVTVATASVRAG